MSLATERPPATRSKGLCLGCNGQLLDVLKPAKFMADGRAGDDDGYWLLSIVVGRCWACRPPVSEWVAKACCEFVGYDMSVTHDVCLTAKQYADAVTSTTVGAVADAPERVHNSNIQMAAMSKYSIVGEGAKIGEDTLYKQAVFEIWPYVSALLSSKKADDTTFDNGWCCCLGRTAVLRGKKFIKLREPRITKQSLADGPTVEEQIFGPKGLDSAIAGVTLICDEDDEKGVPTDKDALAAKFGPGTKDRKFFESTPKRVRDAIDQRITEKHVPFDMTDYERVELSDITEHFCEEIRKSEAIDRIASWLLFGDIKSKKWTLSRAEMALNVLMWQLNPEFVFSAAIKLEGMGVGRPPRMLIADGDAGAVMSALTIGVLERYLCRYNKQRTIKGKPKGMRMSEICNEAFEMKNDSEAHEAFMMENDGSAWDACCKGPLRDLTENKILDVMYEKLYKYFVPYNWFQGARRKADIKKKYTLQMNTNKVDVCAYVKGCSYTQDDLARVLCKRRAQASIDSIRRSGDRGTSILNWLINIICWAWVFCGPTGVSFVHSNGKVCLDIFGSKRRYRVWLEGDDSLLWLTGRKCTRPELDVLEARWTKLGHRPKLFQRINGDVAEFCGWKIVVNKYGLDESTAVPDVPRLLANCFYTTAKEAVQAARDGDSVKFARVVGPALLARAGSIADRVPTIATWLTRCAESLSDDKMYDELFSRDDMYRLGVEDMTELLPEWWKNDDPEKLLDTRYGSFSDNVYRQVSNSVATGGLGREANLAVRHGWVRTTAEWYEFAAILDAVSVHTSDEMFRSIVPPGMMNA